MHERNTSPSLGLAFQQRECCIFLGEARINLAHGGVCELLQLVLACCVGDVTEAALPSLLQTGCGAVVRAGPKCNCNSNFSSSDNSNSNNIASISCLVAGSLSFSISLIQKDWSASWQPSASSLGFFHLRLRCTPQRYVCHSHPLCSAFFVFFL
jgi:hypothetical protein